MTIGTRTAAVLGLVPFLIFLGGAAPAAADDHDNSARGSFSFENQELTDPETSNEVKVGCDFRIDFFGFSLQMVPVTFTVVEPAGNGETLEPLVAFLEDPDPDTGNDLSGSLDVSLLDDLRGIEPAQAQDYDYKLRVEATVKDTPGTEVVKSKNLFIICDTSVAEEVPPAPVDGGGTLPDSEEGVLPDADENSAPLEEGDTLPETGASPWLLAAAAGMMITGGWVLRRFSARASA